MVSVGVVDLNLPCTDLGLCSLVDVNELVNGVLGYSDIDGPLDVRPCFAHVNSELEHML
jgi:hypothetical protein